MSLPYFINFAPNYDLTLTPTLLSRQGVLGQAEFRHRLDNGFYSLRLSGISQTTPSAFLPSPLGAGERDFRGSIESQGRFYINDRWRTGWDVVGVTDKWFLDNYRIRNQSITTDFFREAVSTAYLTGQGDRSYFDARGYYFKGLSSFDWQKQQPIVAPVIDYDKRINGPSEIGGELRFQANITSLDRDVTQYQGLPRTTTYQFSPSINGISFPLYQTCAVFVRGACLIQGLAGQNTRASAQLTWRRSFIDDYGQKFTPFASLRADAFFVNPNLSGYQNDLAPSVARIDDGLSGRVMPTVGLDYRYPFVANFGGLGVHTLEPIGQLLLRPSETKIGRLPNEDAQSLVFDDTSLFEWDKFSGYDRVEGGVRTNLGGQYSVVTPSGWVRERDVRRVDPARRRELVPPGRPRQHRPRIRPRQDAVRLCRALPAVAEPEHHVHHAGAVQPVGLPRLAVRDGRHRPLRPVRAAHDLAVLLVLRGAAAARLQPLPRGRDGLGHLQHHAELVRLGLDAARPDPLPRRAQHLHDALAGYLANPIGSAPLYENPGRFYFAGASFGGGYQDECTTVTLNYINSPIATATGVRERNQTVLLRVELKTLGEADLRQNVGVATTADGIASAR